jgi:hypothetical protein
MKSVKSVKKSTLEEGVHYVPLTSKYIVRGKKNGRLTTLTAYRKKEDAELYYSRYKKGEIK